MIRVVDKNERFIVQKVIKVKVTKIDDEREAVTVTTMRYQVVPVNNMGDASQVMVCDTLTEARQVMVAA